MGLAAFDSLGFSKRLRDGGVPPDQAEAHADAVREYIMLELVTKPEMTAALDELRKDLSARIELSEERLGRRIDGLEYRVASLEENLTNKLTVRLGAMLFTSLLATAGIVVAVLRLMG